MSKSSDQRSGARSRGGEGIAAYVGFSGPETPKYLLTNNFLLEYFEKTGEGQQAYDYAHFIREGFLKTEDQDNEEKMKAAFDRFLDRYMGAETIRNENRRLNKSGSRQLYFPLTPDTLAGSSTVSLRHLLIHLQSLGDNFDFQGIRDGLVDYIFGDHSGILRILKILLAGREEPVLKEEPDLNENFWGMLDPKEKGRVKRLGERLNEDLCVLLTCPEFTGLDFYRRYQYLSILLTSYVIQYLLVRKGTRNCLLCKGDPTDSRVGGNIQRASYGCYVELRGLFPNLLQQYYMDAVSGLLDQDGCLNLVYREDTVWVGDEKFREFARRLSGGRKWMNIGDRQIMEAFGLMKDGEMPGEGEEFPVPAEDFVLRYISLTGSRKGSNLAKISSVLPTSGKQIDMVFPQSNAKQKYFAMSGSLAEFYVRLYLAGKGRKYDYLDNFLDHLTERYRIVIGNSRGSERLLKSVKPRLSALELSVNKAVFVEGLNRVNCLIKLSDSGYVVTLPEKKGDFTLL